MDDAYLERKGLEWQIKKDFGIDPSVLLVGYLDRKKSKMFRE